MQIYTVYFWIAGEKYVISLPADSRYDAMCTVRMKYPGARNVSCHLDMDSSHILWETQQVVLS